MMAAVRILIWLPVRLVRRSSISNMAFSPWRMFVFERASRLHPAGAGKATLSTRRTEAHRDAEHLRIGARAGVQQIVQVSWARRYRRGCGWELPLAKNDNALVRGGPGPPRLAAARRPDCWGARARN